jgi:hypothetical protein
VSRQRLARAIRKQFAQPAGQFGRKPGTSRFIRQTRVNHVKKVHLIFPAEGRQLHAHQRLTMQCSMAPREETLFNTWGWQQRVWLDLLAGKHQVDCVSGRCGGTVKEHVNPADAGINKPGTLECQPRAILVFPPQQNVNIEGDARRGFIDLSHPGSHGMAADDGIRDARVF